MGWNSTISTSLKMLTFITHSSGGKIEEPTIDAEVMMTKYKE